MRYNLLYAAVLYTGSNTNRVPAADVTTVTNSNKLYVSSISTGEAEYYRSYWQSNWAGPENPNCQGNYTEPVAAYFTLQNIFLLMRSIVALNIRLRNNKV